MLADTQMGDQVAGPIHRTTRGPIHPRGTLSCRALREVTASAESWFKCFLTATMGRFGSRALELQVIPAAIWRISLDGEVRCAAPNLLRERTFHQTDLARLSFHLGNGRHRSEFAGTPCSHQFPSIGLLQVPF